MKVDLDLDVTSNTTREKDGVVVFGKVSTVRVCINSVSDNSDWIGYQWVGSWEVQLEVEMEAKVNMGK